MKHNLKTISEMLEEALHTWDRRSLFTIVNEIDAMRKELREHYKEYKELAKPPECDETWYCLQYLELLIDEILGDVEEELEEIVE